MRDYHKHYRDNRRIKFGVTPGEYNRMLKKQSGVCRICEEVCKSGNKLSVDHNHKNGRIRGLLCGKCNRGLGSFNDDYGLMMKAIQYLAVV